uniref:Amelogenin n=1 Tax=Panagrolaimus sp. JU765 TaxID=591449 RepID=A0AC34PWE9_9BILA
MNHYPPQHPPYYRPPPRPLNFFSDPSESPRFPRPLPLNSIDVSPWASGVPPQQMPMQRQPPPLPPAPLFPSANRLPAQVNNAWDMTSDPQYEWSSEPPPPPPAQPAWISSDASTQDQPILDQNERKKLPNWIREGLERME